MEEEHLVCFDGRKTCSPTTIRKRKLASKTLVMIFLYSFQGKQWCFLKRGHLHPVSPRRVEWKGGHLGRVYKGTYGEAPRFQCLHLQVKACIWGILEGLIRANLVWRRANTRFIEMSESCALIGQGGSAFFSTFFLVLVQVRPLRLVERASMWRVWEKSAQVIYPQASNRRSNQYINQINQSRTLNVKQQ